MATLEEPAYCDHFRIGPSLFTFNLNSLLFKFTFYKVNTSFTDLKLSSFLTHCKQNDFDNKCLLILLVIFIYRFRSIIIYNILTSIIFGKLMGVFAGVLDARLLNFPGSYYKYVHSLTLLQKSNFFFSKSQWSAFNPEYFTVFPRINSPSLTLCGIKLSVVNIYNYTKKTSTAKQQLSIISNVPWRLVMACKNIV